MQGRTVLTAAVIVAAGLMAGPAFAGPPSPTEVAVEDDFFDPGTAKQSLGSSTFWLWGAGIENDHNVREDSKLFYSGELTSVPNTNFSAVVASGTYHYYCTEHGTKNGGMDGIVKVRPEFGPADADSFVVSWGDDGVPVESQYDVQYRVGNGDWKDWIKNKTALSRDFGADDKPVNVNPSKTYRFRARTEKVSNPDKRSGFSPQLTVAPLR